MTIWLRGPPTSLAPGNWDLRWGRADESCGFLPQQAEQLIAIPSPLEGERSLATATLLFEALRQRQAAGLQASRGEGIPAERYAPLRFESAYPQVAACCRREGKPYPPLVAEGAIAEELPRSLRLRC